METKKVYKIRFSPSELITDVSINVKDKISFCIMLAKIGVEVDSGIVAKYIDEQMNRLKILT